MTTGIRRTPAAPPSFALAQLLDNIEASVQAAEFTRMETLLRELAKRLSIDEVQVRADRESIVVRLQQFLTIAKSNRHRLHQELKTVEHCGSYLNTREGSPKVLVVTA